MPRGAIIGLLVAAAGVGALPKQDRFPSFRNSSSSGIEATSTKGLQILNTTIIHTATRDAPIPSPTTGDPRVVSITVTSTVTTCNRFGFSGEQTATFSSAAETATLAPNVHWGQDTKKVTNVVPVPPNKGSEMYYGVGDPSKRGSFGVVTYNFVSPSVNLDHSDHVKAEYDENGGLRVTFTNKDAFKHASRTWDPAGKGLVLVAYGKGCEGYQIGERCYFDATHLVVNREDMTIDVSCRPQAPNDLIHSAEARWGYWDPSQGQDPAHPAHQPANTEKKPGNDQCKAGADEASSLFMQQISPDRNHMCTNDLGRRSFWSWIDDHIIEPVGDFVKGIAEDVTHFAKSLSVGGDYDKTLSFSLPKSSNGIMSGLVDPLAKQTRSPWGDALLLGSLGPKRNASVSMYCVDCRAGGRANLRGKLRWGPVEGLTAGEVELHVDASAAFNIGIDIKYPWKADLSVDLYHLDLSGIGFGPVVIGPSISVGVHVGLAAEAAGRMLAGTEIALKDAHVVLDLVKPSRNDVGNWMPSFHPRFEAEGHAKVEATLGMPLGINCGIKLALTRRMVSVYNEVSMSVSAQAGGEAELEDDGQLEAGFDNTNGCEGIDFEISWRDRVWADLNAIFLGTYDLWDSQPQPLLKRCLGPSVYNKDNGEQNYESTNTWTSRSILPTTSTATPPWLRTANISMTTTPSATTPWSETRLGPKPTNSRASTTLEKPSTVYKWTMPTIEPTSTATSTLVPTMLPPVTASRSSSPSVPDHHSSDSSDSRQSTRTTEDTADSATTNVPPSQTQAPPALDKPWNDSKGFEHGPLMDYNRTIKVTSCGDGSVYAVPAGAKEARCSDQWITDPDNTVIGHGPWNNLYYSNDTMDAVGVSKLSVGTCDDLPSGNAAALVAHNDPKTSLPPRYIAVTPYKQVFYLIVCNFLDMDGSQVFLTSHSVAGIKKLESNEGIESVTSFRVDQCRALMLSPGREARSCTP